MENETTMPNDETMDRIAELAADTLRERIMENYGDLIHDAVADAVYSVLGDAVVEDYSEFQQYYVMSQVTSRIAIVAE